MIQVTLSLSKYKELLRSEHYAPGSTTSAVFIYDGTEHTYNLPIAEIMRSVVNIDDTLTRIEYSPVV